MAERARGVDALVAVLVAVALAVTLTGCDPSEPGHRGASVTAPPPTDGVTVETSPDRGDAPDPIDPAYDVALSEPVEDSYYPDMGDPGVDALHYDLALTWNPTKRLLTGVATVVLRATRSAGFVQLDLGAALDVSSVTMDGVEVDADHDGKDLRILSPVLAHERHVAEIQYSGTPEPVDAPTTRGDFSTSGFTITPTGEAWTMQEPYGAHTWYPVNDQPADKALYDFTLTVPSPWVGIANGDLLDRSDRKGRTTTRWHLDEPAASYLTTMAFGDYTMTSNTSASGVAIDYWVPSDEPGLAAGLEAAAPALDWLEDKLGPYPFDTLGFLLVDSESGMETQTMITLGKTDYTTSAAVLLHEMAHQWYGDEVTPSDWRDVWMSEGMAMYLQGMWEAEQSGITVDEQMDVYAGYEDAYRSASGPPAAYDPAEFGEGNIYYGPALMWHELRQKVGDQEFFRLVREWPQARADRSTGREDYLAWLEDETGLELTDFFDAWLLGETTPSRD